MINFVVFLLLRKHNKTMKKQLCDNVDIFDDMDVIFRDSKTKLKESIEKCKPGEPIEGIHPFQYDKLLEIFETKRNKKFTYSVDIKYGDWRFILFDIKKPEKHVGYYTDPKYNTFELPSQVTPIPFPIV